MNLLRVGLVGTLALGCLAAFPARTAATPLACPATSATVVGCIWQNVPNSGNNAGNVPVTLPDAHFLAGAINYTNNSPFTAAAFLNNPTFTDTSAGFNPNGSMTDTFIMLVGQIFLNAGNNSFVVGHDDGVVLNIAGIGTVVNAPGPTGFVNTPFNVSSPSTGLFNFTLQYGECCGAPADLVFAINGSPVGNAPEPASLVLLGTGLAFAARRLTKRS